MEIENIEHAIESPNKCRIDSKKVLVVGGTGYPCTNIVHELWERGHLVSTFNRGNHKSRWKNYVPFIYPVIGNRNSPEGLRKLEHHIWLQEKASRRPYDVIIDSGGAYEPHSVENIMNSVACDIPYYIFISTSGVNFLEEHTPPEYLKYRNDKEQCESIVKYFYDKSMGEKNKYLIARPSFLCGEGDTTNRFDYDNFPEIVKWKHNGETLKNWNHVDYWVKGLLDEMEKESEGIWEQKYYDE